MGRIQKVVTALKDKREVNSLYGGDSYWKLPLFIQSRSSKQEAENNVFEIVIYLTQQLLLVSFKAKRFIIIILIWVQPIRYRRVPTRIEVASGFPFFGELYKNIYVSMGAISSYVKWYHPKLFIISLISQWKLQCYGHKQGRVLLFSLPCFRTIEESRLKLKAN